MKNTQTYFRSSEVAQVGDIMQTGRYGPCRILAFQADGEAEIQNTHTKESGWVVLVSECDFISRPLKTFSTQQNIGKIRHVVNFHDGQKTHKDGSPFFDIATFPNKKKRDAFTRDLLNQGYIATN